MSNPKTTEYVAGVISFLYDQVLPDGVKLALQKRIGIINEDGNINVLGILARRLTSQQTNTDVPKSDEIVVLPTFGGTLAVGDGTTSVKNLIWFGKQRIDVNQAYVNTYAVDNILVIRTQAQEVEIQITANLTGLDKISVIPLSDTYINYPRVSVFCRTAQTTSFKVDWQLIGYLISDGPAPEATGTAAVLQNDGDAIVYQTTWPSVAILGGRVRSFSLDV